MSSTRSSESCYWAGSRGSSGRIGRTGCGLTKTRFAVCHCGWKRSLPQGTQGYTGDAQGKSDCPRLCWGRARQLRRHQLPFSVVLSQDVEVNVADAESVSIGFHFVGFGSMDDRGVAENANLARG